MPKPLYRQVLDAVRSRCLPIRVSAPANTQVEELLLAGGTEL